MNDFPGSMTPSLREQVARDLRPVRPLYAPARRAWLLVPAAMAVAVSAPLLAGARQDLHELGGLVVWGISASQWLLGLWLLVLAFREAVPGENVTARALLASAALTGLVVAGATAATFVANPILVPPHRVFLYWYECLLAPLAIGVPLLIAATLLAGRAFPTRPWLTGALCGGAAGVMTDAGWRLSCSFSDPWHVLSSHVLAIVLLAGAGAAAATLLDRLRWR